MQLIHPLAQLFSDTPVKHLLVDLDGTLLGNHSFPLSIQFIRDSLKALRKHHGLHDSVRTLVEIQKELRIPSNVKQTNEQRVLELFAKRMKVTTDLARQMLGDAIRSIFPNLKGHFFPVDGAKDFLVWAQPHYSLILATNPVWSEDIVRMRLEWAGIDPSLFKSITHIKIMHSVKPHLEYYEEILSLNQIRAEDCILIGDDLNMDLPATQVGIRVFIVGKKNRLTLLKPKKAKAPAIKGTYKDLKTILEVASKK